MSNNQGVISHSKIPAKNIIIGFLISITIFFVFYGIYRWGMYELQLHYKPTSPTLLNAIIISISINLIFKLLMLFSIGSYLYFAEPKQNKRPLIMGLLIGYVLVVIGGYLVMYLPKMAVPLIYSQAMNVVLTTSLFYILVFHLTNSIIQKKDLLMIILPILVVFVASFLFYINLSIPVQEQSKDLLMLEQVSYGKYTFLDYLVSCAEFSFAMLIYALTTQILSLFNFPLILNKIWGAARGY